MNTDSLLSQRKGEDPWAEQHGNAKVSANEGGGGGGVLGLGAEILLQAVVRILQQSISL